MLCIYKIKLKKKVFFFFWNKEISNNLHYNMRPKWPKAVIRDTKTPKNKAHD
jgi:hypothetical protein